MVGTRRDNKHLVEHETRYRVMYDFDSRDEVVQGAKVVQEVEQCLFSVVSKVRDPLAEIMMPKCNEVEDDRGRIVRIEEVESKGEWVPETVGEHEMLKPNETSSGNQELE
ncbi:hypothetical protein PIB30_075281 [Stylosanthes scabra]|uniref:Uncharacterized protein n=1 Tax=Stylosanthes scabra TaxID=79078 RepID=A0ABU6VSI2_9FABA|nr:hypothetical protein [Stylosanthes scabra]